VADSSDRLARPAVRRPLTAALQRFRYRLARGEPEVATQNIKQEDKNMAYHRFKLALGAAAVTLALAAGGCATGTGTAGGAYASNACPSDLKGNECEYYKDGYRAGAEDGKMGMSMAYERHEGYDSRFEPYFARGYEAGWRANR
jgi:hypothetical protein